MNLPTPVATDGQKPDAVDDYSESRPRSRSARWVPWVLFLLELLITSVVIGVLSLALVAQLTLVPGAIFGEYDDILNWLVGLGFTAGIQVIGALILFGVTGLLVGVVGLPIRLIGPLRRAWLGNGEWTIFGVAAGLATIVAAYFFGSWGNIDGKFNSYSFYDPSPTPLLIGWFVLAFSLSLLVWPARWMPRRARAWWTKTQLTKPA